ncbi:stage II sporulation protein P [Pelotomaculum terephthalicicum]|uniref:stage II sporulation protein P n=1 Tax=Pelotomaculum terephthalicicum TaxID=206393 RepID=UPI0035E3E441
MGILKKNSGLFAIALIVIFCLIAFCYAFVVKKNSITAQSTAGLFQKQPEEAPEYPPGRFTTIIDEQENVLSMMSRAVYIGDEIYTSEGKIYRLDKVQGDRASARFLGMDPQIVAYNEFYASQEIPVINNNTSNKPSSPANFAIYHTHSDESYIPSDGADSINFKGGIYKVGMIIAERLRKAGMGVDYDQTPHDPHDNNAYVRSRRTAVKLLSNNPVAMFDVHRDGVPDPNFYRDKISGQNVARLRLVIGRENPRMSANLDFAKQMLTAVNNIHPKVVKEIFVGKGNYNQDLLPTALLIEAGTYTNTREEAERGVALFAEALPPALGINTASPAPQGPAAPSASTEATRGSWKALGWLLGMTVFAGLAFILISDGNLFNARKRFSDFIREIMPLVPRRAARKPELNNENKKNND